MSAGKSNITCNMFNISGAIVILNILSWFGRLAWGCKHWGKHSAAPEVDTGSSKLIKPLICGKHLAKSFVVTRPSPGLLDCSNMAGFCDGGTKAIGGTKLHDVVEIVDEQVLTGKGESIRMDTKYLKHLVVLMEVFKHGLKLSQSRLCDFSMMCIVAYVNEC